jgi:hypothetical protein
LKAILPLELILPGLWAKAVTGNKKLPSFSSITALPSAILREQYRANDANKLSFQ